MAIRTKAQLASDLVSILTNGGLLTALEDRGLRQDSFDSLAALLGNNAFVGDQAITGAMSVSGGITPSDLTASRLVRTNASKLLVSSSYDEDVIVKTVRVALTSAQILALNGTPITAVAAPGSGKSHIIHGVAWYLAAYGGSAYATNTNLRVKLGSHPIFQDSNILVKTGAGTDFTSRAAINDVATIDNQAIIIDVATGNPTAGNSDLYAYITYSTITL